MPGQRRCITLRKHEQVPSYGNCCTCRPALAVSTGVASANPPGPDPLAGVPEPLRSVAAAALQPFAGVWNTVVALVDLVGFGSG